MRRLLFAFLLFVSSAEALSSERLRVEDNSEETAVKDLVRAAASAFDKEDLGSFSSCFKSSRRKSVRRDAALLFAGNQCSMEVVDLHVIDVAEDSAQAAIKYRMGISSAGFEVLSVVSLVKEEGSWAIDRESVRAKSPSRAESRSLSSSGDAPRGGAWDDLNPDPDRIPAGLHHLMGDIGIREGMGCADGRCANGRCEVR